MALIEEPVARNPPVMIPVVLQQEICGTTRWRCRCGEGNARCIAALQQKRRVDEQIAGVEISPEDLAKRRR